MAASVSMTPMYPIIANTAPTSSDSDYMLGAEWLDTTTNTWYKCTNNVVGSVLWVITSQPSSPLSIGLTSKNFQIVEHFFPTNGSLLPVSNSTTGSAVAPTSRPAEWKHPGIRRISTGVGLAVSRTQDIISGTTSSIILDDGITDVVFDIRLPINAPNATDSYDVLIGLATATGMPATKGIYYYYNRAVYGDDFFRLVFINGASSYTAVTAISLSATSYWHKFGIRVKAGINFATPNRVVEFYYGNEAPSPTAYSLIATVSEANLNGAGFPLPYGSTDVYAPTWGIQKIAGSTIQRVLDIDSYTISKLID